MTKDEQLPDKSALVNLCLIRFTGLALEVLLIRWMAAEIHVFAYLKNLILMACVLGMGIGCAQQAESDNTNSKLVLGFLATLVALVAITGTASLTGLSTMSLLADRDLFDFTNGVSSALQLCSFAALHQCFDSLRNLCSYCYAF